MHTHTHTYTTATQRVKQTDAPRAEVMRERADRLLGHGLEPDDWRDTKEYLGLGIFQRLLLTIPPRTVNEEATRKCAILGTDRV